MAQKRELTFESVSASTGLSVKRLTELVGYDRELIELQEVIAALEKALAYTEAHSPLESLNIPEGVRIDPDRLTKTMGLDVCFKGMYPFIDKMKRVRNKETKELRDMTPEELIRWREATRRYNLKVCWCEPGGSLEAARESAQNHLEKLRKLQHGVNLLSGARNAAAKTVAARIKCIQDVLGGHMAAQQLEVLADIEREALLRLETINNIDNVMGELRRQYSQQTLQENA